MKFTLTFFKIINTFLSTRIPNLRMFWKRWSFKKKHVTLCYFWHFPMDLWKVDNWSVQTLKFVGTTALENDFLNAGSTAPLVNRMLEMGELETASLGISPLFSSLCVKPTVLMCSQTLTAICNTWRKMRQWKKWRNERRENKKRNERNWTWRESALIASVFRFWGTSMPFCKPIPHATFP